MSSIPINNIVAAVLIVWFYLWGAVATMAIYKDSPGKPPSIWGYFIAFSMWWFIIPAATVYSIQKRGKK